MFRKVAVVVTSLALVAGAGAAWAFDTAHDRAADRAALGEALARTGTALDAAQADDEAAGHADAEAAGRDADEVLDESRATLTAAVTQGRSLLDSSSGQVADDAVRSSLAGALDAADAALAGVVSATRADALTQQVQGASTQVTEAVQAWQAAQAALAAEAAKASSGGSSSSGVDPCRTTYSGPAFYTSAPAATGSGSNGDIPASAMAPVSWMVDSQGTQFWLLTAATAALERLNAKFRAEFGHDIELDLAYRDLATQQAMRAALGSIAAVPGQSKHGTGRAFDVVEMPCQYGWDTEQRAWLVANGPAYGWVSPSWARENGSNPEYWHYEYTG